MSFVISKRGNVVVLDLGEQLALRSPDELRRAVMAEFNRGERSFLFDFARTGFIDSSGLGVLIAISRNLRELGGELRLANLNEDMTTLFALTKLDTLFQIESADTSPVAPIPGPVGDPAAPPH